MTPWAEAPPPPEMPPLTPAGLARLLLRGGLVGAVAFGGLGVLLALRLVERPLFGDRRPITPHLTRHVCRSALVILGLRLRVRGKPMAGQGAIVANHGSWLDIFALNACDRVCFVAKSEVRSWVGIGWLARATGTVFVDRDSRHEAKAQAAEIEDRLRAGHRLLFFPEGTSTDGLRVLPFKPTLFAAFFAPALRETCRVQPVTVIYRPPPGVEREFYGWWGDMEFGPHLRKVLAAARQGSVEVVFHDPLEVERHVDRKHMARVAEETVREGLPWSG